MPELYVSVSLLMIRIMMGIIFMAHGYPKIFDRKFSLATTKFFKTLRVPAPRFFTFLVGFLELFGGVMLFIGLFGQIWAFLLSMIMVVAIALTGNQKGFKGGYEFELLIFVCGLSLFLLGDGMYSLTFLITHFNLF